ncbi:MAG: TylF/MycF/NovP-related O-methyltransferase [Planctomycetota bacterium]
MTSQERTTAAGGERDRTEFVVNESAQQPRASLATRFRKWWLRRMSRREQTHEMVLGAATDENSYPELHALLFRRVLPRLLAAPDQREQIVAALGPVVAETFEAIASSDDHRAEWIRAQLQDKRFLRDLLEAWGSNNRSRERLMRIGLPAYLLDDAARETFLAELVGVLDQRSSFGEAVRAIAQHPDRLRKHLEATTDQHGLAVFEAAEDHHYVSKIYGKNAHKLVPLDELPEFGPLARAAVESERTLLYYDRLHTLYQALLSVSKTFHGTGPLVGIEVGVFRGGGLGFLASVLEARSVVSQVHGFDTFEGHDPKDLPEEGVEGKHQLGLFQETSLESTREHVAHWPFVQVHQGRFEERCEVLGDGAIHFAHLDVDIYAPTVHGLSFLHERMPVGGVIVVDDYGFTTCPGARRAVDEFLEAHREYTHLPQITGQSLLIRIAP